MTKYDCIDWIIHDRQTRFQISRTKLNNFPIYKKLIDQIIDTKQKTKKKTKFRKLWIFNQFHKKVKIKNATIYFLGLIMKRYTEIRKLRDKHSSDHYFFLINKHLFTFFLSKYRIKIYWTKNPTKKIVAARNF